MKWTLQFRRTRRSRNRRALVLGLIAAQIFLYVGSGLTHVHPGHESDSARRSVKACPASRGEHDVHLHTASTENSSSRVPCRLCEAVRSMVAGLAPAPSLGAAEPAYEQLVSFAVHPYRNPVSRRHAARAPPAC